MNVAGVDVNNLPRHMGGDDYRVWKPSYKGEFIVKSAKELVRDRYAKLEGANLISRLAIHPSLAAQNWKFLCVACSTLDKVKSRFKMQVVNMCCLCKVKEESLEHILWTCSIAVKAWHWIKGVFGIKIHQNLTTAYKVAKGMSRMVKDLWLLTILVFVLNYGCLETTSSIITNKLSGYFFKRGFLTKFMITQED